MKIIISPVNYNDAIELCQKNLDILLVGSNEFATRNTYDCSLDDLKKIIQNKNNTTFLEAKYLLGHSKLMRP